MPTKYALTSDVFLMRNFFHKEIYGKLLLKKRMDTNGLFIEILANFAVCKDRVKDLLLEYARAEKILLTKNGQLIDLEQHRIGKKLEEKDVFITRPDSDIMPE